MKPLHVSRSTSWPAELASQAIGVLGMRGAGKSNLGRVYAEELFNAEIPFVVFDPVGAWVGIRSGRDGRAGGGLPVPIFGGAHGDLPLDRSSGPKIADLVIDRQLSCVLDLSHEDFSETDKQVFLAAFGDRLYRRKKRETGWLALILEEADDYAPQPRSGGGGVKGPAAATLGVFQRLVRRGRSRGLGALMITQRSAAINKDLLYMVGTLVAFRTTGPRDQEAIDGWLKYNQPEIRERVMSSLAQLGDGEAWVIAQEALGSIDRIQFRRMRTYDTGATPEHGEQGKPATLADIDVPALDAELKEAVEKAKATDPRELQKKVADLQRELAKKEATLAEVDRRTKVLDESIARVQRNVQKRVEVPVLKDAHIRHLEAGLRALTAFVERRRETEERATTRLLATMGEIKAALAAAQKRTPELGNALAVGAGRRPVPTGPGRPAPVVSRAPVAARRAEPTGNGTALGRGERATLVAVAQYTGSGGATREQLSILTGYKRSSRDAYLARLRAAGYVDLAGENIVATLEGVGALGPDFEPLPFGDALLSHWLGRLPEGERRILGAVTAAYPNPVERADLDAVTGYKRSSRDAYISRLSARKLVRSVGAGSIRAADELFG